VKYCRPHDLAGVCEVLQRPIPVSGGLVQGAVGRAAGVTVYKGVPFAATTGGGNRWRGPQPVKPWPGVRMADAFGDACPQPKVPPDNIMVQFSFADPPECAQSEDCLNLNVWTPASDGTARLPVIVWIYGGGHRLGAGSHPCAWGDHLAAKGCVVVAPNYRVGSHGYLAHPALTGESGSSGNYACLDILAALRWVRDNIAAFGGDPGSVTLYGQSAGGALINVLLASKLTRGLVHRAIIASAGRMHGGPMGHSRTLTQAEQDGAKLMDELGAHDIAGMRALSSPQMFKPPGTWQPIIDGHVIAEPVQQVFDRHEQLQIPIMSGWTAHEAMPFPNADLSTRDGLLAHARTHGSDAERFLQLYDATDDARARASSYRLRSDSGFAYQPWQIARAQTRSGQKSFLFDFTQAPPLPPQLHFQQPRMPFGYGAYHGAEIWYAFGNFDQQPWAWTDADRQVAERFGRYIVNFARNGDPNGAGLVEWSPFDPLKDQALHIGARTEMATVGNREALHFHARRFGASD
jgi:para-nitrobenzyl esterase